MYQINDLVVYNNGEVCSIFNIGVPDFVDNGEMHYILKPVNKSTSTIYVKMSSPELPFRYTISQTEALAFLETYPSMEPMYHENNKIREKEYLEAFRACHPKQWLRIYKGITIERKRKASIGKQLNTNDDRNLHKVEKYLSSEFASTLKISTDEALHLLMESMFASMP
ncbi:MAG: hypothetical protein R3Y24_12575 [Eubacteriales bacterium]